MIFNKNFQGAKGKYELARSEANFNEPVPLFGLDGSSLKEALVAPFLNEKGHSVLKDLMHVLKAYKGHFYNKYITHITSLLLIFFDESQTYELLATML